MIRWFLLQNRAGRTRLAKYYLPLDDSSKRKTEYEVFRVLNGRESKWSNIVDVRSYDPRISAYATTARMQCQHTNLRTHITLG